MSHAVMNAFRMAVVTAGLACLAACGSEPEPTPVQTDPVVTVDPVWPHDVSDLEPDPAVRYGQLENGMRYAILANDTPPNVASVRLVFNIGSLAETEEQRGLAHFIEHMAFNGSQNVPEGEMVALLERYGLQFGPDTNAFTGYDTVGYQLDLPEADDDTLDTALFLMRETADGLLLDADAIDRERNVILSEERVRNTPIRRWNNALTRFRMPGTLIPDRDPIGLVEVVETAQREAFLDYYENYYVPQRAMLVVTGSIDPESVEARIEEKFADWSGPETLRPDPDLGTLTLGRPFSSGFFYDPEIFTILTVDAVRPYEARPDNAATRLETAYSELGDVILSRRFDTIMSSGTSPLLQAQVSTTDDYELAERSTVLLVSTPDRWQEALELAEQEVRRALIHGFTQAELDEQLANLRTGMRNAAERSGTRTTDGLADAIWSAWRGDRVFTHPEAMLERFLINEDRITVDAVNASFRARWDNVEPLIFLSNSQEVEDAQSQIRDVWVQSYSQSVEPPEDFSSVEFAYQEFGEPAEVVTRTEIEDLDYVQFELDNGVRVNFKQTDFRDEQVRVRVDFGRGKLEPSARPYVDELAGAIFTASGLEAHSADELSSVLAGQQVGVDLSVGADSFSLSGITTPTDLDSQLNLITAYFTHPGWRPEGFSQFASIAPEIRRNLYGSPGGVIQAEVSRLLRSGDTRYGFPSAEQIEAISLDEIIAYLTPVLAEAPIEVTILGDVDEATALAAVQRTLGALPKRSAAWPMYEARRQVSFPAPAAEPVELYHNGVDYQGMANIYWPTRDAFDTREAREIALLRAVFDLKLTQRLREQEGFTYSAAVDDTLSYVFPDYGYLWVGVDVQINNLDAAYQAVEDVAAEIVAGQISEDEFLRARRPILEGIEERFESNGWWLAWLARSQAQPQRLDIVRTLVEDYQAIEIADLVQAAETYLDPDRAWRVSIVPRPEDE